MLNFCDLIQVFVFTTNHHPMLEEITHVNAFPFVNMEPDNYDGCEIYMYNSTDDRAI